MDDNDRDTSVLRSLTPIYLHRYISPFLWVFTVTMIAVIVFSFIQTPMYEATVRIKVEPQSETILPTKDRLQETASRDANIVDTEVEALYNLEIARRVVAKLALANDPAFADRYERHPHNNAAAYALADSLKISRAGSTFLIDLTAQSTNRVKAAKIANQYASEYLRLQIENKRKGTRSANALLTERIDEMAGEVEQAERAVQQYKISNGLMSVNGATLAEQSIASIDSELANARADERAAYGRLNAATGSGARWGAAGTPALEGLLARRAEAEQNWRQARELYGDRHPHYQQAETQFRQSERAVAAETSRARTSLSASRQQQLDRLREEARAATGKRVSLSASISNTRDTLSRTNRAQVNLNILERKAQAVRATYEAYLGRYQETSSAVGTERPDAQILSVASIPVRPEGPTAAQFLMLGGLFAFLLALSASIIWVRFRRSDLSTAT